MFRGKLGENCGLLMVFRKQSKPGIWMFGMRFPIDIVFISSRKRVVDVRENVKPLSLNPLTWRVYYPRKPAKYVLELSAGAARATGTKPGDRLGWDNTE